MNRKRNTLYLSPEQEVLSTPTPSPQRANLAETGSKPCAPPIDVGNRQQATNSSMRSWTIGDEPPQRAAQAPVQAKTQPETLEQSLRHMAGLIANITESYTVAIFLADNQNRELVSSGVHTLSREFLPEVRIGFGSGLVGWTAENRVRISVCPFERDASTLLYYAQDQDLKSFIAVPILASNAKGTGDDLLGVIACDSKKSYAYAKIAEKILIDCAAQTAVLLDLYSKIGVTKRDSSRDQQEQLLARFVESLRTHSDEESLLASVTLVPQELIERDALILHSAAEAGVGAGRFYPASAETRMENRLLDMVCKHKKVPSNKRSVHALPLDDSKQRSFLSIPFRVLDREAGSLNLLSKPYEAFTPTDISALERVAEVVGRELERIRLREQATNSSTMGGILSWKQFSLQAKARILTARTQKERLDLVRISLGRMLKNLENSAGIAITAAVANRIARLIDQVSQSPSLACLPHGSDFMIMTDANDTSVLLSRLERLLKRLTISDFTKDRLLSDIDLGTFVQQNLEIVAASYPNHGETIDDLVTHCRRAQRVDQASDQHHSIGEVANAGNW